MVIPCKKTYWLILYENKLPRFRVLRILEARGRANAESVVVSRGCGGIIFTFILGCLLNNKTKKNTILCCKDTLNPAKKMNLSQLTLYS